MRFIFLVGPSLSLLLGCGAPPAAEVSTTDGSLPYWHRDAAEDSLRRVLGDLGPVVREVEAIASAGRLPGRDDVQRLRRALAASAILVPTIPWHVPLEGHEQLHLSAGRLPGGIRSIDWGLRILSEPANGRASPQQLEEGVYYLRVGLRTLETVRRAALEMEAAESPIGSDDGPTAHSPVTAAQEDQ